MPHPFESIPSELGPIFPLLAGVTVLLLALLGILYRPLKNETAPQGMISLELSWTAERLSQILASWSEEVRMAVAFSLGLNFLCLIALTSTLALACVWAGDAVGGVAAAAGDWLAWGQLLAAAVWAVQNSLLAAAVLGRRSNLSLAVASSLAIVKFALVGAGLLFAVLAGIGATVRGPAH